MEDRLFCGLKENTAFEDDIDFDCAYQSIKGVDGAVVSNRNHPLKKFEVLTGKWVKNNAFEISDCTLQVKPRYYETLKGALTKVRLLLGDDCIVKE